MLNRAASTPGAFEFKFERTRGVLYNPENIENLKNKSQEYLEISAYQEKYNILSPELYHCTKLFYLIVDSDYYPLAVVEK